MWHGVPAVHEQRAKARSFRGSHGRDCVPHCLGRCPTTRYDQQKLLCTTHLTGGLSLLLPTTVSRGPVCWSDPRLRSASIPTSGLHAEKPHDRLWSSTRRSAIIAVLSAVAGRAPGYYPWCWPATARQASGGRRDTPPHLVISDWENAGRRPGSTCLPRLIRSQDR